MCTCVQTSTNPAGSHMSLPAAFTFLIVCSSSDRESELSHQRIYKKYEVDGSGIITEEEMRPWDVKWLAQGHTQLVGVRPETGTQAFLFLLQCFFCAVWPLK